MTSAGPAYTTILSSNYLPKALALAESLRRHEGGAVLHVLIIDFSRDEDLPDIPGVRCLSTASLGLPEAEVLDLAMGYNLVEFATAVKPLLLGALLEDHEEVAYLDPDTYLTSPMVELWPAVSATEGGILLTPHFLKPIPPGAEVTEGHVLLVGVFNLGFCAVDRRARPFLDWWWGHLRTECLLDPLAGLFVDQKWMDLGSALFGAGSFRHSGYNVGVLNLHERPIALDDEGYVVVSTGDRLRLFHFHAFDATNPRTLSVRFRASRDNPLEDDSVVLKLAEEYAALVTGFERTLPPAPPYPYGADTRGRPISRLLRRAHRVEKEKTGLSPPSPFDPSDSGAYDRWRRRAWRSVGRELVGDAAKWGRIVLPEEFNRVKRRFPRLTSRLSDRLSGGSGIWG